MSDARQLAHHDDPDTSHDAAEAATHRAHIKAAIVWMLTEGGPQTAFELRDRYFRDRLAHGWPRVQPHSVDRRLSELHVAGAVVDSGMRRYSEYNRAACVWELTPPKPPAEG
jgi:hypothetical protein